MGAKPGDRAFPGSEGAVPGTFSRRKGSQALGLRGLEVVRRVEGIGRRVQIDASEASATKIRSTNFHGDVTARAPAVPSSKPSAKSGGSAKPLTTSRSKPETSAPECVHSASSAAEMLSPFRLTVPAETST